MNKLRIGLYGTGRGWDIAKNFIKLGCEIVAICDNHAERRQKVIDQLGDSLAVYDDFNAFVEHDMDAVILANYFHEHAPAAIACLERGIHVFSECISNGTMAEGVALVRAAEKSTAVYMLAENYPQMKFNREMQRIAKGGTLGKIMYAEGEYNHPTDAHDVSFLKKYNYFQQHWRNMLPPTYYITHSLGPIMCATGATPKKVTAFIASRPVDTTIPSAKQNGRNTAIVLTQNDDSSVFRVAVSSGFGGRHNSYRLCGTNGQIENIRGMDEKVMLRYNSWSKPEGAPEFSLYEPGWNDADEAAIKQSGHGGSDFITARMFVECIREGKQPIHPFNVYSAVTMSSVAILGYRSVVEGGKPYDIPDFQLEADRRQYENDTASPFYGSDGSEPTIPCCPGGNQKPTEEQLRKYEELLKS